ncbi:MAG: hypothetical protein MJ252_21740 [archaeon]|nr:hypothetical protein [archaeon]
MSIQDQMRPQIQPPIELQPQIIQQQPIPQEIPQRRNQFNPDTYIPPSYDLQGFLKPSYKQHSSISKLREENIKIPWNEINTNASKAHTRTELLEIRKKERIPDISYDLDKDGYVGNRDMVISKLYDLDRDGKLNETEKKNAYEGLANGIENKFLWNIKNEGGQVNFRDTRKPAPIPEGNKNDPKAKNAKEDPGVKKGESSAIPPFRLLQKRGKFVMAEDFMPVRETYPRHPISDNQPEHGTFSELKAKRKQQTKEYVSNKIQEWEDKHKKKHFENYNQFDDLSSKQPLYKTFTELKNAKHMNARLNCGLTEKEQDIKDIFHDPSLAYIYDPKHKTKGDLDKEKQRENLEQHKKLSNINHKGEVERLNEREDEIFYKMFRETDGKTYSQIKEKMRKEAIEYNTQKFSKNHIGVHGHELPKFSENKTCGEFWKNDPNYNPNPKYQSQVEYKESIKYWKPEEELYLNEHRDELPQTKDPFKKEYHPIEAKKENLIINVSKINHFKNFDPNVVAEFDPNKNKVKHIYRWTTLVNQFAPNKFSKGRFFDNIQKEAEEAERMRENLQNNDDKFNEKYNGETEKVKEPIIDPKVEAEQKFFRTFNNQLYQKFSNFEKVNERGENKYSIPKGVPAKTQAFGVEKKI